jgi:RNA polymerase sigma factor (sigma-70 family)
MFVFNEKNKRREDEDFFNKLYEEHYGLIYEKIKFRLYSGADDDITSCTQETFIKAWMHTEDLKKHENVTGWLVLTAKRTADNFNRLHAIHKRAVGDSTGLEDIPQQEDFTEEVVEEARFNEFLKLNTAENFINSLSESERQLYEMKFRQKLSNEKIGEILKITPNAVASRNKRLIQKFKKEFLELKK